MIACFSRSTPTTRLWLGDSGIKGFLRCEVLPYATCRMPGYVSGSVKVDYKISFSRHFYRLALERETEGVLGEIIGDMRL